VARYWSINTAATAVPLSVHPSPLVITTKLAVAILGGGLFGGVLPAPYCPCGENPTLHANFMALYFIETELSPIETLHRWNNVQIIFKSRKPMSRLLGDIILQTERHDQNYTPRRFAGGQK